MSHGEASVVRLAPEEPLGEEEVTLCLLPSSSLTVSAPAPWLSRVPYFATRLKEPWVNPSPQDQYLTLKCTPGSSPRAYLKCLRLIGLSPQSWLSELESVDEALEVLRVADHLLFQECWDACMEFLASTPWSIEEEDTIRVTISALSMEPSCDMKERLDTSQDPANLASMLLHMISKPSLETCFCDLCKKCLKSSSAPLREALHSLLLKLMASLSAKDALSRQWHLVVKCLMRFTDAQQVILEIVNSETLLSSLASPSTASPSTSRMNSGKLLPFSASSTTKDSNIILEEMLEKVLNRTVLLSNSQRSWLVKWSDCGTLDSMRLRLAQTLPLSDPIRISVVKSSKPECLSEWADQVVHRIERMDEVELKALWDSIIENFKY